MDIDWKEIQSVLSPLKDYEDCCRRYQKSFAFPFVLEAFNLSMPDLNEYTQKLLLGDARNRYISYNDRLTKIIYRLEQAEIENVVDLVEQTSSREELGAFSNRTHIPAVEIVTLLKYLIYWLIPGEKYLSGLVREDPSIVLAIKQLSIRGIRTNLEVLEKGRARAERKALSETSGIDESLITDLVNRADFSRLPWTSKATISNIIGAGYPSLADLRNANPEKLYGDFYAYGRRIGKNLKLGNEIENSYRIAKIVPLLVDV
jgi:hypothetical protein